MLIYSSVIIFTCIFLFPSYYTKISYDISNNHKIDSYLLCYKYLKLNNIKFTWS